MQSESVTKRSQGYDVWFAKERTWTARVTCPAPAELYPGEKGPFRIFDCLQKNLVFCRKMWYFSRKIRIYYAGFTLQIDLTKYQQRRGLMPGYFKATIMSFALRYQSIDHLQAN